MKVIITGSTGMIGKLILSHCIHSDSITDIISFVRKPSGIIHKKLNEVILNNFEDYSGYDSFFNDVQVAFFCLGVYTGQVTTEQLKVITVNYPVEFAKKLERYSPKAHFCLLSGAGADRTEKSKTPFARFKGMAENQLAKMDVTLYSFRPAYIYPVQDRKEPNIGYRIMKSLYPIIQLFGNNYSIKSTDLAQAIFQIGMFGSNKQIFENRDILKIVKPHRS